MTTPPGRPSSGPLPDVLSSLLAEGFEVTLRLRGWSMKPFVPSGARVRFSPAGEVARGDVVLARHPGHVLVAHRVIAIDGDRIWTKGDACRTADAPVSRESILAKAVRVEGRIALPLSHSWTRLLGLAVNRLYPGLVAVYRTLFPRQAVR